ncbi:hypothetical protein GBA52_023353 [Prunus armeniaca]|nr:hypothetical protein GBA52_023353 [Prunus armeniaca]
MKAINVSIDRDEELDDTFDGVKMKWCHVVTLEKPRNGSRISVISPTLWDLNYRATQMFSLNNVMPQTASSMFSAYASFATFMMVFRSMANDFIPDPLRTYIPSSLSYLFSPLSGLFSFYLTLAFYEYSDMSRNQVYDAAAVDVQKRKHDSDSDSDSDSYSDSDSDSETEKKSKPNTKTGGLVNFIIKKKIETERYMKKLKTKKKRRRRRWIRNLFNFHLW